MLRLILFACWAYELLTKYIRSYANFEGEKWRLKEVQNCKHCSHVKRCLNIPKAL